MTDLQIRPAVQSDAQAFLDLWEALDTETEFMLFEPNERKIRLAEQKSRLAASENSSNTHVLILEHKDEKKLAGFCAGRRSENFRDKHTLHIVIGLRQESTGKGWGQQLLSTLEQWALKVDVIRLELSVMKNNTTAIALYRKVGFVVEGTKKNAVCLRSGFVDEYIMAKLIG